MQQPSCSKTVAGSGVHCACTLYYKHLNTNFVECKSRVFAIDEPTWEVSLPAAVTTVISVVDGDVLAV